MRTRLVVICLLLGILVATAPTQAQGGFLTPAFKERIDGAVMQTTDATPTTIFSYGPIDNEKVVFVEAFVTAIRGDWSQGAAGSVKALFGRRSGSNLGRVNPTPPGELYVNTLSLGANAFAITANTSTQKIDVTVTGLAATSIQWWLSFHVRETQ